MSYSMYYCAVCNKVFKSGNAGKKMICKYCSSILLDMNIDLYEYTHLDTDGKRKIKNETIKSSNSNLTHNSSKSQIFIENKDLSDVSEKNTFSDSIDSSKYVVIDVETNGLSSKNHDLLSLAIYRPDTNKLYHRYFPLELNDEVLTTQYNGITKDMLLGATPLTQAELNDIIDNFELFTRTILTYGELDEKFIQQYFYRHNLIGFLKFKFYNFKHDIISSCFSEGNITKDNLCKIYHIENITNVHSADNDCILEWKLYEKMNGNQLLITNNKVFEFNTKEYIIPISYISTYNNFKYHIPPLPRIISNEEIVNIVTVKGGYLRKFPTNFNGIIIETLINKLLEAKVIDSKQFYIHNKSKLRFIGKLETEIDTVPIHFNEDGSVKTIRQQDEQLGKSINAFISSLKKDLNPLIEYIKKDIFRGEEILSQELVIHEEKNILATCDLSSKSSVLEIKTVDHINPQIFANQIYYEAKGRDAYMLFVDWKGIPKQLQFVIVKMNLEVYDQSCHKKLSKNEMAKEKIETDDIELINYINKSSRVILRCRKCGHQWDSTYYKAAIHSPCPMCEPKIELSRSRHKPLLTVEEKLQKRAHKYYDRILEKSNGQIKASNFIGSKELVDAKCTKCGYTWTIRADHLINRCYCRKCKY